MSEATKIEALAPADVFDDPGALDLWMQPLRQITDRFDDLRGDIHAILQMHWLEHRDPKGWAVISPADLMSYRNKKLWGGSRTVKGSGGNARVTRSHRLSVGRWPKVRRATQ